MSTDTAFSVGPQDRRCSQQKESRGQMDRRPPGNNSSHPLGSNSKGPYPKNFPPFLRTSSKSPPPLILALPKKTPSNYSPDGSTTPPLPQYQKQPPSNLSQHNTISTVRFHRANYVDNPASTDVPVYHRLSCPQHLWNIIQARYKGQGTNNSTPIAHQLAWAHPLHPHNISATASS